jgi:DNA helicase-2/ATP-dependent DNA helicase PcrA
LTVDEAQDFGALDLAWLLDLAPEPRSVTLAGDFAQRASLRSGFDSWDALLGQLGLSGTAISPLRVGYRSTAEIAAFATHVLGELRPDRPWHAVRQGLPVELFRFDNAGQAVALIAEALQGLAAAEPASYVALIARHSEQADLYHDGLERCGLARLRRVREQDFAFEPGIEVTDVMQVKGLEFDYVILLDVDAATYPDDPASRYLLHIAATRAAHQLWLVACREPSPLLPPGLLAHEP